MTNRHQNVVQRFTIARAKVPVVPCLVLVSTRALDTSQPPLPRRGGRVHVCLRTHRPTLRDLVPSVPREMTERVSRLVNFEAHGMRSNTFAHRFLICTSLATISTSSETI